MSKEIKDAYKVLQVESGIKKGDRVKVLRLYKDHEMGCAVRGIDKEWLRAQGDSGIVLDLDSHSIYIKHDRSGSNYHHPFFVLEVVESIKVIEVRYFCDGEDITDDISDETKRNLKEKNREQDRANT